jgi:hypothetical protein
MPLLKGVAGRGHGRGPRPGAARTAPPPLPKFESRGAHPTLSRLRRLGTAPPPTPLTPCPALPYPPSPSAQKDRSNDTLIFASEQSLR